MSPIFKAIVWKELRENLKWGIVILLGMAAGLILKMDLLAYPARGYPTSLYATINNLEGTVALGAVLAGLLIGGAQALAENRGDKWGFLTHRPASRSTLFWGKATAGILLYATSTGVPVAAALSVMATPGYLPVPFDWRISLPLTANLLCGLVFYFAACLTGMRQARWYASRALGIATAAGCIGFQAATTTAFWQAAAVSAAGLIIVGTAAWSTFVAGGHYGVQPRIGRVATAVSIGLGITLVGLLAFTMNIDRFGVHETSSEPLYTNFAVTSEGVVAKVVRNRNNQIVEVSDLDGHPLEQYRNLARGQTMSAGVVSASLSPQPQSPPSLQSVDWLFTTLRPTNNGNQLDWYYVHRLGLLAAYDNQSRRIIGWMGPDGFSAGEAKPRPFGGKLKNRRSVYGDQHYLVFEDAVYRMDLVTQSIEKIFQSEPAERLLDASSRRPNAVALAKAGEMAQIEVIATTQRVIVQLRDGTRLLEAPQDSSASEYTALQVLRAMQAPGTPTFLWYQGSASKASRISEFNSAGAVVNSWTLPPTTRAPEYSLRQIAITSAALPPIINASSGMADRMKWIGSSLSMPSGNVRWAVAILSSLLSAAAVFSRGRRYAFTRSRLYTWTVLALLLGPLSYLLMLALIEWPALESCPVCSKKRVVTRESCEHCGEPFAAPPKNGTEIFEPMPAG